jgi:hypothetical protein
LSLSGHVRRDVEFRERSNRETWLLLVRLNLKSARFLPDSFETSPLVISSERLLALDTSIRLPLWLTESAQCGVAVKEPKAGSCCVDERTASAIAVCGANGCDIDGVDEEEDVSRFSAC